MPFISFSYLISLNRISNKNWMEVVRLYILLLFLILRENTYFFLNLSFSLCLFLSAFTFTLYHWFLSNLILRLGVVFFMFLMLKIGLFVFICRPSFHQIWKIFNHFSIFILVSPHVSFGDSIYRYIWSLNIVPQFTNAN